MKTLKILKDQGKVVDSVVCADCGKTIGRLETYNYKGLRCIPCFHKFYKSEYKAYPELTKQMKGTIQMKLSNGTGKTVIVEDLTAHLYIDEALQGSKTYNSRMELLEELTKKGYYIKQLVFD